MIRRRRDRTGPASPPEGPFQPPHDSVVERSVPGETVAAGADPDRTIDPDAASATTVMSAVPPPADQPSAQVLNELRTFFTGHGGGQSAGGAGHVADAPAGEEVDEARASGGDPSLQPAPTRWARRRSRKEAKREAKEEAKRLKAHAKQAAREVRKTRKAGTTPTTDHATRPADGGGTERPSAEGAAPGAGAASGDTPGDTAPPDQRPPGEQPPGEQPIVSIVDGGDLPDAVYLNGDVAKASAGQSLGGAGPALGDAAEGEDSPRTVFIDDHDPATGSIVPVEAATSPPRMEPRLRDRRMAVQRALGRKRLKVVGAVAACLALVVAGLAVLGSGAFAVSTITVEGVTYSAGAELEAIVEELGGANVFRIDTAEIEAQLERIPWVAHARVSTRFPNSATIEIAERRPVASYRAGDGRWRVLDLDGRVLTVVDGQPVGYLPILAFDSAPNLSPGANAPRGFRGAATLARMLGGALAEQVSEIAVNGDGSDLRMYLAGGVEVRFGAATDLIDKLVRLDLALTDPDHIPTELIDVSTQDYVVR